MARNIVLAVSTLAVLVLVFVGYGLLVGGPAREQAERRGAGPMPQHEPTTTAPLKVGDMLTIPAGGKIMFRRYDDKSGRPRDMFLCRDWQPVPGSKNEIRVAQPELAIRLPSGMIATISAEEGQITVDRLEQSQMRPKLGWLSGSVRMVVDRDTEIERSPTADRHPPSPSSARWCSTSTSSTCSCSCCGSSAAGESNGRPEGLHY